MSIASIYHNQRALATLYHTLSQHAQIVALSTCATQPMLVQLALPAAAVSAAAAAAADVAAPAPCTVNTRTH